MDNYAPGTEQRKWPKQFKAIHGDLPDYLSEEAQRYIRECTRVYPFQMRHYLGDGMWLRFCETWAYTGSMKEAMRSI